MTERSPEQPQGWSPPGWDAPQTPAQDAPATGPVRWDEPSGGSAELPPAPTAPPGWDAGQPAPPQGPPAQYGGQYGPPAQDDGQYGPPAGWGGPVPGAPRPGVVPLRPLGLGELLDGAVSVVRGYPRPTLGPSLVVALITTVLGVALFSLLPDGLFTATGSQDVSDAQLGGVALGGIGTAVITALAGIVLAGVITAVVGRAVLGQPMTTGEAWRAVRPLLGRLVGLAVVTFLIVVAVVVAGAVVAGISYGVAGGAGLALGIPVVLAALAAGVYVYVRLALAAPVMVLEKTGIGESLRRSGVLVRSSWWRVFGVLLLTTGVAFVVSNLLQVPFLVLGGGTGVFTGGELGTRELVLNQIGAGFAQTLTAPFTAGVTALLYVDRRMRAEGLDVALAAAAASPRP